MTDLHQSKELDRYVSFIGLDCDGKAERFAAALRDGLSDRGDADPFWVYFDEKLRGARGPAQDPLYHIHCHLNDLRDLLVRADLNALIDLLEQLEVECC